MSKQWKWSATQAISIVAQTYCEDWCKAAKERATFLHNPDISALNDKNITGLSTGDKGGQVVIFIHGSPANAMRWLYYLSNVPNGYNFISIDRMGFGERGEELPNLEQDFAQIKTFINQFEKPIIVGHSLGGAVATRLASEQNIKKLVLIASSIDPKLEKIIAVQKLGATKLLSRILSRSIRNSNLEMLQLPAFLSQSEAGLGNIVAPVDIIHPKDDALVSYNNVDYAKKYFVNSQNLKVIAPETGGHFIPWTNPELIMKAITNE